MKVIEAREVSKRYGGLLALNQVSMHVDEGEIVGLIGPNGAGKTTFLNAIAGLDPPTSGSVFLMGEETTGLPPEKMCHLGLSRTFQIPRPFPKLTAQQNVLIASYFGNPRAPASDHEVHTRAQLEFVEFPMPEDTICERLNTLQLKRLDLARALASNPKLILLDELAAGLTFGELNDLMAIIRRVRDRGTTIMLVEHIVQVIMGLCDRLVVIQFGHKIADGPTLEVIKDPIVEEAYLGEDF